MKRTHLNTPKVEFFLWVYYLGLKVLNNLGVIALVT